ncbi:DNA methyltransferase [uncultured Sneathiella sp.]|uniref:site-specific DNA-methyltransferase n=1 Tax=uncultured Sneathiella sp. TaxID=879315 RepID=UPI0030DA92DD
MARSKKLAKSQAVVTSKLHNQVVGNNLHVSIWIEHVSIDELRPYQNNPRKHSNKQIRKLKRSIREYGFIIPVLADRDGTIISGHARVLAALELCLKKLPVIFADHLTPFQVKGFRLLDNRLSEEALWNRERLKIEFAEFLEAGIDLESTGFDIPEIDFTFETVEHSADNTQDDEIPQPDLKNPPVSQLGDLWLCGGHRVLCGDALNEACYLHLLGDEFARQVITDPPYNVKVKGHIRVSEKGDHKEFIMASGEMSDTEFTKFLTDAIINLTESSQDGSVHYIFMDWRHLSQLQAVCDRLYTEQLNLCVWVKNNGGMGSFYRSQHELVLVCKNGTATHLNNIQLGKYGRNRTNVWEYTGANSFGPDRQENLDLHPTVKPVAMIADAILDSSAPGDIILDPFLGSGTLIIAAEKTGRKGRGMELDPHYVDVAIKRWQDFTGQQAIHAELGLTFDQIKDQGRSGLKLLPPPSTFLTEGGQSHE